jgi:hypothetical protein
MPIRPTFKAMSRRRKKSKESIKGNASNSPYLTTRPIKYCNSSYQSAILWYVSLKFWLTCQIT